MGACILRMIGSILQSAERPPHFSLPAGDNNFEFTRKVGFLRKEWIANYQGHQIRVTNSWIRGARLYIDGALCAANRSLIANPGRSSFSGTLSQGNAAPKVEVYFEVIPF